MHTVVIGSRKLDVLTKTAKAINSINKKDVVGSDVNSNKVIAIQLNVRKSDSISNFITQLLTKYNINKIDYLINNAGGQYPVDELEDISEKGWKSVIDLNLNATFLMSKAIFLNFFQKQLYGKIINITANYFTGMGVMPHSGAARSGVHNLTITMAQNWGKYNVCVNEVAPGLIKTSGFDNYPRKFVEKVIIPHVADSYLYRYGVGNDVSNVVIFLLSPGADFLTGVTIPVDGGESIFNPLKPPVKPLIAKSNL